jgi:hypothetical protein
MDEIMKIDKDLMNVFIEAGKKYPNHKRKLWMQRFDDEVIRMKKCTGLNCITYTITRLKLD